MEFSFNGIKGKRNSGEIGKKFDAAERILKNQVFKSFEGKLVRNESGKMKNEKFLRVQRRENLGIMKENFRLSKSIVNAKPSMSVKKLSEEYNKSRKYIKFFSKPKSNSKTPRPGSRQEVFRPLMDTLNTYLMHY